MRRRFVGFEPLEQRCLLSATVFENDGIGYFLNQSSHRLERYDIAQEAWLAPIDLSGTSSTPTAALVDDDGIYAAYDKAVYRYNFDGSSQRSLFNAESHVNTIHSDGNLLFINYSCEFEARFTSIDKTTNAIVDTIVSSRYSVYDSSISQESNRIIGCSRYIIPDHITYVSYDDDGKFTGGGDSPYMSDLSTLSETWIFPDGKKIVGNTGTIYSVGELTRVQNFAGTIDDITFLGPDTPIILKDKTLTAYSPDILPTGSITLNYTPSEIFVSNTDVVTFTPDASLATGFRADIVPLSSLTAPQPGQRVDPAGLAFTPDKVEMASDGTVLLYSKAKQSIFRWDPVAQRYCQSIPLIGAADYMAYSSETNTAYLAYASGLIRKLDLNSTNPVEEPFAILTGKPFGLATADQYVIAVDGGTHYSFAPNGDWIETVALNYVSTEYIWNDANQKMYFFSNRTSPDDLFWEEINANGTNYPTEPSGGIGSVQRSMSFSNGFANPIKVAPDGSIVLLGSGMIHDALSLERKPMALANSINDATWLNGELFTVRNVSGLAEFQRWSTSHYELSQSTLKYGTAVSLLTLASGCLLAVMKDSSGIPFFLIMNEHFENLSITDKYTVKETQGGTLVNESGASDTLEVVLNVPPTTNVVIKIASGDLEEVAVSPASLTFTPDNWNTPQKVTVSGVDDALVDGRQTTLVKFSVDDDASDNAFDEASDQFIPVINVDNETVVACVCEHNDIGYFFVHNEPRVERYDIGHETWLEPIMLSGATGEPTAGLVDNDGIYVAYGTAVYRYNLDGSEQVHLLNTQYKVIALQSDGNLLFINYAKIISFNKLTNKIVDVTNPYTKALFGSSIAASVNRLLGRSEGVSPPDITYLDYDDEGTIIKVGDSPYHGDFPIGSNTWVFPGDGKMVDSTGTIYATSDLRRLNSFGTSIDDIDFLGTNVPIVLNGNKLTAYTPSILPTGNITLDYVPKEIFVSAAHVITFTPDVTLATGFRADLVSLEQLHTVIPDQPVDPVGLAFTPDKVELTADGTVLLYSKAHQSIFRWDPAGNSYGSTIPLRGTAEFMAYSQQTNTAYLLYASGTITKLDLNAVNPVEAKFATIRWVPQGLSTAGSYLFAVGGSLYEPDHCTFAADGTLIDLVDEHYDCMTNYIWSNKNEKMYFISNGQLNWQEINASGAAYPHESPGGIGSQKQSAIFPNTGFSLPIRISPDGRVAVLGSGMIHDATTLERLPLALANKIDDAAWLGDVLFTARNLSDKTEIQYWAESTYELTGSMQLPGTVNSLFTLGDDRLLCITIDTKGIPLFSMLNFEIAKTSAIDNVYSVQQNEVLTGNVITDDTGSGVDGTTAPSPNLQVMAVNGNRNAVGSPIVLPSGAILTVQADGSFRYVASTSKVSTFGEVFEDSFIYTIAQAASSLCDESNAMVTINVVPPIAVAINQASAQADRTIQAPIHFTAVFGKRVIDFSAEDVLLGGTATGMHVESIAPLDKEGTTYDVAVSGMTSSGSVTASIIPGRVHDTDGYSNSASISEDNSVDYLAKGVRYSGTSGDDNFVIRVDSHSSAWTIEINQQLQQIPENADDFLLDGISGNDTFSFYGDNSVINADLRYTDGIIQFGIHTIAYTNFDSITASGSSGNDTAILHDSAAADAFQGLPGAAQLMTTGKTLTVKNFKSVAVQATSGNDTGAMFGSQDGASSYVAGPAGVNFAGPGFNYTASGFKALSAYAVPGKANTAVFNSTVGRDLLIASYLGAQYIGQGFSYDVWNVPSITGNSGTGDEARFYGSPGGNSNLTVSATQAVQSEPGFTLKGNNYETFSSYVYPDGNTTATIVGTAAADRAVTSPWGAQLFGDNLALSAWTYRHITINGNGGNDVADMYGTTGANRFTGQGPMATMNAGDTERSITNFIQVTAHGNLASTATFFANQGVTNIFDAGSRQSSMSGPGYNNIAVEFGAATGYAIPGGTDVANYTDSPGDTDYFISSYMGSQMFGPGYSNAGWNFAQMYAYSTGGADVARFYGSPTCPDSFVAAPGDAKHSGQGYQSEAKNFARVEAFAGIGTGGTAELTGSSGDDNYVGSPLGVQLWNQNYRLEAWNFASVKAEGNGGNDTANLYGGATNNQLAADNVFAQFSGNGFANRVDHFATTAIHGSTTGTDSGVLDHAYLETGLKNTPDNNLGHTINRKLWLYDFDTVATTKKPDDAMPHPQPVDKLMTAFLYE